MVENYMGDIFIRMDTGVSEDVPVALTCIQSIDDPSSKWFRVSWLEEVQEETFSRFVLEYEKMGDSLPTHLRFLANFSYDNGSDIISRLNEKLDNQYYSFLSKIKLKMRILVVKVLTKIFIGDKKSYGYHESKTIFNKINDSFSVVSVGVPNIEYAHDIINEIERFHRMKLLSSNRGYINSIHDLEDICDGDDNMTISECVEAHSYYEKYTNTLYKLRIWSSILLKVIENNNEGMNVTNEEK